MDGIKPRRWIASARDDLSAMPTEVRRTVGCALLAAQQAEKQDDAKVLKGFGDAAVLRTLPIRSAPSTRSDSASGLTSRRSRSAVQLTFQIAKRIKALGLTQTAAAARLGISQPDVSRLMKRRPTGFSTDRLLALLTALDIDVDIVLRPTSARAHMAKVSIREELS